MTRRTCDSSVIHIAAICGTELPTLDASRIAARCRVATCLALLARLFSATASSCASGLTNTSGGRITTSTVEMRPHSPPTADFRSNLRRRATSRTRDHRRDIAGRATLARSARGAGRRGLCQELVRLAVLVSWPRDRDLDLDDSSASGRALDLDPASERFDSIPEPGQSRPPPRIGSADAVIANRKSKHVVLDTEGNPHARGVRVLRRVGQRLGNGVVGGHLDLVGEPVLEGYVELNANGGATSECFERRRKAARGEFGWMDALRQLAEPVNGRLQPLRD